MRPLQSKMLVEFPQAFRQMLPIIVAQLVVLLKDTSLGYIVGYTELLRVNMNQLASFYGNRYLFSFFIVTLVLYLVMNLSLSWFARWLSRRTASTIRAVGDSTPRTRRRRCSWRRRRQRRRRRGGAPGDRAGADRRAGGGSGSLNAARPPARLVPCVRAP